MAEQWRLIRYQMCDVIGQCLRCVRGIEVTDATLDMNVIREACLGGPGQCYSARQTLSMIQTAYFYPQLSDRTSPKEWLDKDNPELIANLIKQKNKL